MASGNQVKNGKAFEYSIAKVYYEYLMGHGVNAEFVDNPAKNQAKEYYDAFDNAVQSAKYGSETYYRAIIWKIIAGSITGNAEYAGKPHPKHGSRTADCDSGADSDDISCSYRR